MLFFKKKKIEIKETDIDKINNIRKMMHPGDTSIDKSLVNDKTMSYKPLNDRFKNIKK